MIIRLKTVCPELLGPLPDGEYEVPDACTAEQALLACMESGGLPPPAKELMTKLLFLKNLRHIGSEDVLCAGDRLTVLRPLFGG